MSQFALFFTNLELQSLASQMTSLTVAEVEAERDKLYFRCNDLNERLQDAIKKISSIKLKILKK